MKNGIVVLGTIFIDIKGYPLGAYIPTGRNAGRVEEVHGGVARNVVEDIANLELRPTFISLVDGSDTGEAVIKKLGNHKVNTKYIRTSPDGMGIWLVIFDNTGDVSASISKRPDLSPIDDILDEYGDEIFRDCDSIALEFDMEKSTVKRVIEYANKYNKEIYALVSNMSIAIQRRDLLKHTGCFICNQQEAGIFFSENYDDKTPSEMQKLLREKVMLAGIRKMVVTLGSDGAVYADEKGDSGYVPAIKTDVIDTSGAGDSFFAGVCAGLTYGKSLKEACEIGTRLAASVIASGENVCPRFSPEEFGFDAPED